MSSLAECLRIHGKGLRPDELAHIMREVERNLDKVGDQSAAEFKTIADILTSSADNLRLVSEQVGINVGLNTASTQKNDYARYQEIQEKWAKLLDSGINPDSPEIKALWQENEEIKNRHGGMPPEAPSATTTATTTAKPNETQSQQVAQIIPETVAPGTAEVQQAGPAGPGNLARNASQERAVSTASPLSQEIVTPLSDEIRTVPDASPDEALPGRVLRLTDVWHDGDAKATIAEAYALTGKNKGDMRSALVIEDSQTGEVYVRGVYKGKGAERMVEMAARKAAEGAQGQRVVDFGAPSEGAKIGAIAADPRYSIIGTIAADAPAETFARNFKSRAEFEANPQVGALAQAAQGEIVQRKRKSSEEAQRPKTVAIEKLHNTIAAPSEALTEGPRGELAASVARDIRKGVSEDQIRATLEARFNNDINKLPKSAQAELRAAIPGSVDILLDAGKRIVDRNLDATVRAPSNYRIDDHRATVLFRDGVNAIRSHGGEVAAFAQNVASELEAIKGAYGLQMTNEEGKSLVALGIHATNGINTDAVVKLYHEAAHQFVKSLPVEQQNLVHQAIDELPYTQQKWLLNPFSTDLRLLANARLETLSPAQKTILAGITAEEMNKLRSISPTQRITEQAAEHLAMLGIERGQARTLVDQVIRLVKDVILRMAMAIQKTLGLEPNARLASAWAENAWMRWINRDFSATPKSSMRVALGLNPTFRERVPLYLTPESRDTRIMEIDLATGQMLSPDFLPESAEAIRDDVHRMILAIQNDAAQQVSQTRRGVLTPESYSSDLGANWQIAHRNEMVEFAATLYRDSAVRLAIGNMSFNDFLNDYLHTTDERSPEALKEALLKELSARTDPLTNKPIVFDPTARVNTLPAAPNGEMGSGQQKALERIFQDIDAIRTRVGRDLADHTELFDRLDSREQLKKRPLSENEKKLKADAGVRIKTLERIVKLLDEQLGRVGNKLGETIDTPLVPGGTYLVPETATSHPDSWVERKIPINLKYNAGQAEQVIKDSNLLVEWLRTPGNEVHGGYIAHAQKLARKLREIPINQLDYHANVGRLIKNNMRGTVDSLVSVGTPAAQWVKSAFYDWQAAITAHQSDAIIDGDRWSAAYGRFKEAIGRKKQYDDIYQTQVWTPIAKVWKSFEDGAPNRIERSIEVLNRVYKLGISGAKQRAAFVELFNASHGRDEVDASIHKSFGLSVKDTELGIKRGLIRRGAFNGRWTLSKQSAAIEGTMRGAWVSFGDKIDALVANKNQLKVFFTPVVVRDFVEPLVRYNYQTFDAVDSMGNRHKAQLANVRLAWEAAKGDMAAFAAQLHVLEGGTPQTSDQTLKAILANLNGKFAKLHTVVGENDSLAVSSLDTMPRAMMDAQTAEDFPPEWLHAALYDAGSNQVLVHKLAINKAFGESGLDTATGEFNMKLSAIMGELQQLQYDLAGHVERGLKPADIKKLMGADKYTIAIQAADHLDNLGKLREKLIMLSRTNGANFGDLKPFVELLGLGASSILQQPRSALLQGLFEPLSALYHFRAGKTGWQAVGRSYRDTAAAIANGAAGLKFNAEMTQRLHDAGIKPIESFLTLQERLSSHGAGNYLSEQSTPLTTYGALSKAISKGIRNVRTRLSYGLVENAVDVINKMTGRQIVDLRKNFPNDRARGMHLAATAIFSGISQATVTAQQSSYVRGVEDMLVRGLNKMKVVQRGLSPKEFESFLLSLESGARNFTQEELGYTNDPAWGQFRDDLAVKMREGSPERLMAQIWRRTNGNFAGTTLLNPMQVAEVATIADAELSLKASPLTVPSAMLTNPILKAAGVFLSWPYMTTIRGWKLIKGEGPQGQVTQRAAIEGMVSIIAGILPATIAASFLVDFYDEKLLGKKANLRNAGVAAAIPVGGLFMDDPLAILERVARFGSFGFVGDALSQGFNADDSRGGGISLDNRVLALSSLRNFISLAQRTYNQDFENTYASTYRPLMNLIGMGAVLQYEQLLANSLGLNNIESAVIARISAGNYLRAEGRAMKLDVRSASRSGMASTPATPWIGEMENAAMLRDTARFRNAYQRAIKAAIAMKKEDPVSYVKEAFASRHPLRSRIFSKSPSETEYRRILANLDDTGRDAVGSAVNNYNFYLEKMKLKPFYGVSDSKRDHGGIPLSMTQAHLLAAQAAANPDF